MNRVAVFLIVLLICYFTSSFAQEGVSIFHSINLNDNELRDPDTLYQRLKIKSITEEKIENNKSEKVSYKEFDNGYLMVNGLLYDGYPDLVKARIHRFSKNKWSVAYQFPKRNFIKDSTFFDKELNVFISRKRYKEIDSLKLLIDYHQQDDTSVVSYFTIAGEPGNKEVFYNPYPLLNSKPIEYKKSLSINDTLLVVDTLKDIIANSLTIRHQYISIFNEPVKIVCITYQNNKVIGREQIFRKFDRRGRKVLNEDYLPLDSSMTLSLGSKDSISYNYDGSYKIYRDRFLANGKWDIVELYDKYNRIISYKHFLSEGGNNEMRYTYLRNGLLAKGVFYIDDKYIAKTEYFYTYY